eukprot:PhF_6_TR22593/c1_g1_i4/m.32241
MDDKTAAIRTDIADHPLFDLSLCTKIENVTQNSATSSGWGFIVFKPFVSKWLDVEIFITNGQLNTIALVAPSLAYVTEGTQWKSGEYPSDPGWSKEDYQKYGNTIWFPSNRLLLKLRPSDEDDGSGVKLEIWASRDPAAGGGGGDDSSVTIDTSLFLRDTLKRFPMSHRLAIGMWTGNQCEVIRYASPHWERRRPYLLVCMQLRTMVARVKEQGGGQSIGGSGFILGGLVSRVPWDVLEHVILFV